MTSTVSSRRRRCWTESSGLRAGGVGERAGLLDRAQEGRDPAVVAAQVEDLLDHGAVLALELTGVLVVGLAVVDLLDLDAEPLAVAGLARPGQAAVQPEHGRHRRAAARAAALDHLGDDADAPELAVAAGKQEDALLVADVDRQRGGDAGEDECVVEGNQEVCHVESSPIGDSGQSVKTK